MNRRRPAEVTIEERPRLLDAWGSEDPSDWRRILGRDLGDLLRAAAEARNEIAEAARTEKSRVRESLVALIEVLDAFDRVFASIHEKQALVDRQMKKWIGNFRTIWRMLNGVIDAQGVRVIENLDDGFDPRWHKAAEVIDDASKPEGTIVQELKKGYLWRNEVLRKAEVVVVGAPEAAASWAGRAGK